MSEIFKTERDMCAEFIEAVNRRNDKDWTVYPETSGFDILLVRNEDGFQIGVEAKLRLNAKVVAQSLPTRWCMNTGPDCRAVLVPGKYANGDLKAICDHIGVTVITISPKRTFSLAQPEKILYRIQPDLPQTNRDEWLFSNWHEWSPDNREVLPEVVPDCDAGCPSPIRLTDWKIRAIKIVVLLEKFGTVTRQDFKELGINAQRWTSGSDWLKAIGKNGRLTQYVAGPSMPEFKLQHPKNYEEIAVKINDWLPENRQDNSLLETSQ